MPRRLAQIVAASVLAACSVCSAEEISWKKFVLSDKFYGEGASFGDFNKDGKMDVVSGPYWYEGPDFKTKHEIYKPTGKQKEGAYKADGEYSDNFFSFVYDFNRDGYSDVLVYGFPGREARVYVNPAPPKMVTPAKQEGKEDPKPQEQLWRVEFVFDSADNESPQFADFDGDGQPDGIFHTRGYMGYATFNPKSWELPWEFHPVSSKGGWQRFTHGYGFGDVNGDGKNDLLTNRDWWENPGSADPQAEWKRHPVDFGQGGAQIYVYDVDGDGMNDVITSLQAHGVGLAWFKQGPKGENGEIKWTKNLILPEKYEPNQQGIKFSQLHAVDLVDMNGDGLKDIVTGKRFYAHHSTGDVAPKDPAVLYWFELKRGADKSVEFIGHKIDDDSGVGTQVVTGDLSGDGKPDVVVGNKKGTFVFIQQ
jgi:hypothetical protein